MKTMAFRVIVASPILATGSAGALGFPSAPAKRTNTLTIRIDVLPGVAEKVVEPTLVERIAVAIFGDAALDAREVDPSTVSLNGAAASKREDGTLATYRDVDGDGRADLLQLVGPSGGKVLPMSDVGGGGPGVSGVKLTFDDDGPPIPIASNPSAGIYAPSSDSPGDPETMPPPAPGGISNLRLSVFNLADPNGTWSLYISDDAGGDVGYLAGGWSLFLQTYLEPNTSYPPYSYCNWGGLTIPSGAPGTTSGPASQYPPGGFTAGFPPDLDHYKLVVDLFGLTHSYPSDLDILMTENSGRAVMLMSDAGGGAPEMNTVNITFNDDAATYLPAATTPLSGSYKPTDINDGFADTFPAPCCFGAPATGPYSRDLSAFKGLPTANGWYLRILDDTVGDTGFSTGWCIRYLPSPPPAEVPNRRWTDPTTLVWDAAISASSYSLFRGDPSQLPAPLDASSDSCQRGVTLDQRMPGLTDAPAPGSFYWYIVLGHNAQGDGPQGFDRIAGQELARIQDATG